MPRSDFPGLPEKPQVPLVGGDGNAFAIMGRAAEAMRRTNHPPHVINTYMEEAMSGDYDNLLRVTLDYVEDADRSECEDDE